MADYIEREAAKNALREIHQPNTTRIVLSVVAIDDIPAADVRPVERGHWIDGTCSNCGFFTDVVMSRFFSYCPNCGANMREPPKEE